MEPDWKTFLQPLSPRPSVKEKWARQRPALLSGGLQATYGVEEKLLRKV